MTGSRIPVPVLGTDTELTRTFFTHLKSRPKPIFLVFSNILEKRVRRSLVSDHKEMVQQNSAAHVSLSSYSIVKEPKRERFCPTEGVLPQQTAYQSMVGFRRSDAFPGLTNSAVIVALKAPLRRWWAVYRGEPPNLSTRKMRFFELFSKWSKRACRSVCGTSFGDPALSMK